MRVLFDKFNYPKNLDDLIYHIVGFVRASGSQFQILMLQSSQKPKLICLFSFGPPTGLRISST